MERKSREATGCGEIMDWQFTLGLLGASNGDRKEGRGVYVGGAFGQNTGCTRLRESLGPK